MSLIADVIFPAFEAPYLAPLLFPVAGITAMVAEVMVFWLLNRAVGIGKVIRLVVLANVVSGIIGFLIAGLLPSGLVPKVVGEGNPPVSIIQPGPQFNTYMLWSFVVAFALSVVIEYGVVRSCVRWASVRRPLLTVTLANLTSYVMLIAVAWLWAVLLW